MSITQRVADLNEWLEQQPAWLRPPIYGALIIVVLIGARGALVLPFLIAAVAVMSPHPIHDIAMGAAALGAAVCGGALAGLAYSIGARWLRPIPVIGPYIAGILTVIPYFLMVILILRLGDGRAILAPLQAAEVVATGIASVIFGAALGQALFTEEGLR